MAMGDPLSDCRPLISAAASGKLRLVRLLVEGGAQVNGHNPRGETALLAACKALRGEPTEPDTLKLLTYLLHNKADPNAQDRAGRTALMYACMGRAGAQVASTLLSAGADPSIEDCSGASALAYAINGQHQPTVEVLMDAFRARGRDIVIITTEMGVNGSPVTRRYLNVAPSPDTSPVSCMSPSDIVLKTGSPNSPEGENIFNFRGVNKRGSSSSRHPSCDQSPLSQYHTPPPRHRVLSEPWLAIHKLACLNRAYEEGIRERSLQEETDGEDLRRKGGGRRDEEEEDEGEEFPQSRMEGRRDEEEEDEGEEFPQSGMEGGRRDGTVHRTGERHGGENYSSSREDFLPRLHPSAPFFAGLRSPQAAWSKLVPKRILTLDKSTPKSSADKLPAHRSPQSQIRRNTLPSLTVVPPHLHLPPLVSPSDSHLQVPGQISLSKSRSMGFLPHPPSSPPPSSSPRAPVRPALLPPIPLAASATSLARASLWRHSVQLGQIRAGQLMNHSGQ